ncbi:MAG TPA: molecular chaperone Skp, partial [Saprospirales bacterium]|nr:molecular chaperone Skp [Saprospirales bacterium]
QAVGKEEGYTFIFDSSTGVILHASETENVFDKVKVKLGL